MKAPSLVARIRIAIVILTLSAQTATAQPRYHVRFIIADDLTATALSCYGSTVCRIPNIDRIAASGTRFTHAYCQGTYCGSQSSAGGGEEKAARVVPLLDDTRFKVGFNIWSPKPGRHVKVGVMRPDGMSAEPRWGLAQWHSRFTLAAAQRTRGAGNGLADGLSAGFPQDGRLPFAINEHGLGSYRTARCRDAGRRTSAQRGPESRIFGGS